jgi:probable HAF family extracellular repeat protein
VPSGINNAGQIVGLRENNPGFLLSNGTYTTMNVPGSVLTAPIGINNAGQIVGDYFSADLKGHGFLYSNGTYTPLDFPGAVLTTVGGINDFGQIVGDYSSTYSISPQGFIATYDVQSAPEPTSFLLFGPGLVGLLGYAFRRRKTTSNGS